MKEIFQKAFSKFASSIHHKTTLRELHRENTEFCERIRDLEARSAEVTPSQVELDESLARHAYSQGGQSDGAPNFYDLNVKDRERIVSTAIDSRQTLISRWEALASERTEGWETRAQQAASMLGAVSSVADVGCGMMTLEKYLSRNILYIPLDVVRRDVRTVVIDLNKDELPDLGAECVVGLGLLEYLFDVPSVLRRIACVYRVAVLSYNPLDRLSNMSERTGHAWVNHYAEAELESLFHSCGLQIEERVRHETTQTIWRLSSNKFSG
ncbi:hypothetical protein [Paraburkholderia sacchari]|uniref:Uncharacterized protein n=1 Tax=Paraburkholderia sacchari TaxID=159450 RepID=A0A8T6ZDJ7_9BURK|nr:hypothetical protein [Paraburkholderia sacchari]NLP61669.1 hypothetical protein [Paraburkholderia sacchari]